MRWFNFTLNLKHSMSRAGLLVLLLTFVSGNLLAQLLPEGTETLANTTTANSQQNPGVAVAPDGTYMVVWESFAEDGDDYGIYLQIFDNTGTAVGSQRLVNPTVDLGQRFPDVGVDENGNFIIVFMSESTDPSNGWDIWRRSFNSSSSATSSMIRVNSNSTDGQVFPKVAAYGNNSYNIVYAEEQADGDFEIFVRRYVGNSPVASSAQLSVLDVGGTKQYPDIATDADGDFVVTWQSSGTSSDGDGLGIVAAIYDSGGTVSTAEFLVNTTVAGNQQEPSVAMANDGNILIVWSSYNQDAGDYGVFGQRFDGSGAAQGSEFQINQTETGTQGHADVAVSDAGDFVVTWTSFNQDGDRAGVYARTIQPDGTFLEDEKLINTRTVDYQEFSAVGVNDADNNAVIVWQDGTNNSTSTNDGSNYGVYYQRFLIADTVPPTAVCQNVTVYLDGSGNGTLTAAEVDNGSTDNVGITNLSVNTTSFTCADLGTTTVVLTATDAAGLTGTCNAVVTVVDTLAPVVICQNHTAYLDGTGNVSISTADINNGSSDNCNAFTLGLSQTDFTCADLGTNTVTLTGTDDDLNTASCNATVTVLDTISPTVTCQNVTIYLNAAGNASITTAQVTTSSSDNCGTPSLSLNTSSFTCANLGANTVTVTATDGSSNTGTCTAIVTVLDTISPTASCQNITVFLDGSGNATITAADVDGGSSDACSTPNLSIDVSSFTCADLGSNTVTLTATDGSSNSSTCTATVTVMDTVSPTVACQNITVFLNGAGSASITAADIDNGSSDNCGTPSLSLNTSSFTCANVGANSVTLTATDGEGNTSSCTATVTVVDSTSPTAVCQNITVYLNASGNASITAADIDNGSSTVCGSPSLSINVSDFTCADLGANTVTLTASNGATSSTCNAIVTVLDTLSPTVACQNLVVFLDGSGNASITAADVDNGSSDNCGTPSLSINTSSFTCADIGAQSVMLTATDGEGNTSTCTATVFVQDTTSPNVVCQNITVFLDGSGNASITAADIDNGSSDNCGTPSLSLDVTSFTCANAGANTVMLTATDGEGNSSTCSAIVTVVDSTPPTAVCQDITVYLNGSGNASITAADVDNGSSIVCGTPALSIDISDFTCADIGTNTVTLSVSNGATSTTCTSTVTVLDTLSPTVACQNLVVFLDGTGNASITAADVDNGSSDNCGTPSLSLDVSNFTCADIGSQSVMLTATDGEGNTSTCTATVFVQDSTSPNVVCQNITVFLDGSGNASITTADVDNGSSDNCGTPSLSLDVTSFTCADAGANTVMLTATDGAGNTSTCSAIVTVVDSTPPTAVCQDITVYLNGSGNASITAADVDNGSSIVCGTPALSIDVSDFTCADIGTNTVTLSVSNGATSTTCTSTVTVLDTLSPTVACQTLVVFLDGTGNASITAADVDNGSSDNCGTPSLSLDVTNFTCADIGSQSVMLTATDGEGNASTCTATVFVQDTTSPNVVCQNITVFLDGSGNASITAADVDNGSSDNCGTPSLSLDVTSFTCADAGANTVMLTATDGAGNSSTCSAIVTVVDSTPPTAVCQDITVYLDGSGNASITAADVDNGSSIVCGTPALSIDVSDFTCADIGTNTVTLTVSNGATTTTCTSTVTVLDTLSPTVACQNLVVFLDGTGNASITAADVDNGSSDNCGTPSLSLDVTSFTCADIGSQSVMLTATDGEGNTSTCTATVFVQDTTSPNVVCQNLTVFLDGSGNASITTADVDNGSSDNCGTPTLSLNVTDFTCADLGVNMVTLTGDDGNGNTASCTAMVTVVDSTAPVVSCQDVTVYLDGSGNASIALIDVNTGSSDNCGAPMVSLDITDFTCADLGANTVTITAVDASSNMATCTATVTVVDSTAPVVACQNLTLYLDASGTADITAADLDAGSTDNCGAPTLSADMIAFDCATLGANLVTLTATDAAGNASTCMATVTVLDTTVPMITGCPADIQAAPNTAGCVAVVTWNEPTATDNCAITTTSSHAPGDTFQLGITTVTYYFTDQAGNVDSCQFNVDVVSDFMLAVSGTDLQCNGDGSGTATATISGGAMPYTILWNNLSADANQSNLDAGVYTVTVTDANGCTRTDSVAITEPAAIMVAPVITDVLCHGDNTGSAILNASGGTGTLVEDWGFANPMALPAGTHVYTISDDNGCTYMDSVVITEPTPIVIETDSILADCGISNGQAWVTISGGAGSYDILWDAAAGSVTTDTAFNLPAGGYVVTVTDSNGCVATAVAIVANPAIGTLVESSTNPACNGDSTGTASVTVMGGASPPFSYLWSTGDTTSAISGLPAGNYFVEVTDASSCVNTLSITLTEPDTLVAASIVSDVLCTGDSSGTAQLSITGGTGMFTVDWGVFDPMALPSGTFTYTITDANGCVFVDSVEVDEPTPIVIAITASDALCNGDSTGSASLAISGGTPGYTIDWFGADSTALSAGVYPVQVTDANGCVAMNSVTIGEPLAVSAIETITNVGCNGDSTGSVILTGVGGTPGYTFDWFGSDPTALAAGIYDYMVTDTNGCTFIGTVTITEPDVITLSATATDELIADDGTIDLTVDGGTTPYTFDWDNDGTGDNDDTEDLTGLSSGTYHVTVTDANGCSDTLSVNVGSQVGIGPLGTLLEINLFPNPNHGEFTVELIGNMIEPLDVEITDQLGKVVLTTTMQANLKKALSLQHVERGVYYLHVGNDNFRTSRKFVVH